MGLFGKDVPIPYPVPVYPPSRSRSGLSYAYLDACMENCHLEEQLANSEERRHEERHRHRRELRAVKKRMREEGRVEGKAEGIKEGFDQVKMLEEVWNSGRQSKGTSLTTIYDAPQQQQQLLLPAPPPSYQNSEQLVGASLKAPSERSHYSSKPASAVTSSSHENMKRWLEVHPSSGRSELGQDPIVGSAQPSHSQATRPAPHLGYGAFSQQRANHRVQASRQGSGISVSPSSSVSQLSANWLEQRRNLH